MDKKSPPKNNPWSNLPTITTFDKGSSTCPSKYIDGTRKKSKNKIVEPCSPSIIVSSLVNYICQIVETDPGQRKNLYAQLLDIMEKMNLIDTSYKLAPYSFAENRYKDAIHQLITVAKRIIGSNSTLSFQRPVWTYTSLYHDQFEETGFIAGGGFGNVFKAKHKLDQVEYAIKKIIVKPGKIRTILTCLEEVTTLAKLNHSNIVSYKQAWIEPYTVYRLPQLPSSETSENNETNKNEASYRIKNISPSNSNESNRKSCRNLSLNDSDDKSMTRIKTTVESLSDCSIVFEEQDTQYSTSTESNGNITVTEVSSESEKVIQSDSDDISFREEKEESSNSSSESSTDDSDESLENIKISQYSTENSLYTILYIQMELCDKTLRHWLDERTEPSPVSVMTNIASQMLYGLNYIHSKHVVHHDIKPSNIFVSTSGKLEIQLGDFGLACPLIKESHDNIIGTSVYAAPEQLEGQCNPKSDIYSLGVIFLELLVPMKTISECVRMIDALKSDTIVTELASSHPKWIDTIKKLLQKNPEHRPSSSELLEEFRIDKDLTITKLESENSKLKNENSILENENSKLKNEIKTQKQMIKENETTIKKLRNQIKNLALKK